MERQIRTTTEGLIQENEALKRKLSEAEETLHAIKTGAVDALAIKGNNGTQIYTLEGADHTYRIFIEEMNEGAVTLTRDGLILYSNNRFAHMVNTPLEKVIGNSIYAFAGENGKDKLSHLLDAGWEGSARSEIMLTGENESPLQVQLSVKSLEIDSLKAIYLVVTDISERIESEKELTDKNAELKQSNSDLEQFAYVASHDLKEPVRMIASYSGLLLSKLKNSGPEVQEYGEYISEGVLRIQELIRDLLEYARIGHEKITLTAVDTGKVLQEALHSLKPLLQETGAIIESDAMPVVKGNKTLLTTVFQNLIDNSIKFRNKEIKPFIEIKCQEKGNEWVFSFRDNGIGLDQQYENRIFVIFQRLHTRDEYDGSGIGLSICKKIVEFHGGSIWLESKEGDGTTFYFSLPKHSG
jgi:signal transduction histidine kinase